MSEITDPQITDKAYEVAINAALAASSHVLKYWPNPLNPHFDKTLVMKIFEKSQGIGNYATIADTDAEGIILKAIGEASELRGHGIMSEESSGKRSESEWQWVIDPIDGTLNFRNGLSNFGISIGLLKGKEAIMGIIAMPAFSQIIVAKKGQGAKLLSFEKKLLADLRELAYIQPRDKALIAYDTGYEDRGRQMHETAERVADKIGYLTSYASCSYANYHIALGSLGAYFHQTPTKYDIGAAAAIIPEVGGVVTDMNGKPIDWSAPQVSYLASRTPEIHKELLEIINK